MVHGGHLDVWVAADALSDLEHVTIAQGEGSGVRQPRPRCRRGDVRGAGATDPDGEVTDLAKVLHQGQRPGSTTSTQQITAATA